VTLVARARNGFWFSGWAGACGGRSRTCTVDATRAREVHALFVRELEIGLDATSRLVFHLPHERATVTASVRRRGLPLANAEVRVTLACADGTSFRSLRTDGRGRVSFAFGQEMRNEQRVATCRVTASVTAHGRTATAEPTQVGFIHPLWLERRGERPGGSVVRIWGRAGEDVELLVDGATVARARIGRPGWVDVVSPHVRRGATLSVTGDAGHHSHTIRG